MKKWAEKNKAHVQEYHRQYYLLKNNEQLLERNRIYRANNQDRVDPYHKKYAETWPERVREAAKRYYDKNREAIRKKNRERYYRKKKEKQQAEAAKEDN